MNRTKKNIIEAAIKVFSSDGYKGATMDEIASKAGVAKGTLYYNFNSKEQIFNYIIDLGMNHLTQQIADTIHSNLSAAIKLKDICRIQLTYFYENKDFVKVLFSQIWGSEQRQVLLRDAIKRYVDSIEMIIKEGIENNEIKAQDPSVLAHLFFGSITSTAMYDLINSDKNVDLDIIINTTLEFSLRGINANLK